jgi:dihydrofolate reductase
MKNISIIVSISNNGCIGGNNTLLWKQSDDLKRFKKLTTNHVVIMGEKTFHSIGMALPNRCNIVISDNPDFHPTGCFVAHSIEEAMDEARLKTCENWHGVEDEIFIMGGGSIYKQFMPYANKLYITRIDCEIKGDTYFPYIGEDDWDLISKEHHNKDDNNEYNYNYETYIRR